MATGPLAAWRALGTDRDRAELYRMWRVGASAGFGTRAALQQMGPRASVDVEAFRLALMEGATRGHSVHETLARRASIPASRLERTMLAMGEESGSLDRVLTLLAEHHERRHRLMLHVQKRLAYPMLVALVAAVIGPLPLVFQGRAGTYAILAGSALAAIVLVGGALVTTVARRYESRPPLVRARVARTLATAVQAGLPLGRAARLAAETSGDPALTSLVGRMSEVALSGQPLAETMRAWPGATPELLAVLDVAERTGDFSALVRLADAYEDGFR